jgi:hypothetical protein
VIAKITKYTSNSIPVRTVEKLQKINGQDFRTYLLFVPKRAPTSKPVFFTKSSPDLLDQNGKKPKSAFKKGLIYARIEHECKPVNDDPPLLDFVYSYRTAEGVSLILDGGDDLENNLPPRDPNLIRFIGRKNYLNALWKWLSERRNPIKVLTALGGIGKTTVAYEFATQLLSKPGTGIDKVVWLSGKKLTFSRFKESWFQLPDVIFKILIRSWTQHSCKLATFPKTSGNVSIETTRLISPSRALLNSVSS